jgi:hypothetical protein
LRGPQDSKPSPGTVPWCSGARVGAHVARATAGGGRTVLHRGVTGGRWLQHEPRQGLHHEHRRRMANPPDMARRTNS